MDIRTLEHMGWLTYEPVQPVRKSMLAELVYFEHWQALVRRPVEGYYPETPNAMLADILRELPLGINQREAAVATTLIVWLGTSCGQSFIHMGRRFAQTHTCSLETGYLIAWAVENSRSSWTNGGYRLVESLLSTPDDYLHQPRTFDLLPAPPSLHTLPKISTIDLEVCELVARWLGSELGQAFITECEREIDMRRFARPPAAVAREVMA